MAVARTIAKVPAWLGRAPLASNLVPPGAVDLGMIQAMLSSNWLSAPGRHQLGSRVLLLCPSAGPASVYRERLAEHAFHTLAAEGWFLGDLPAQMADVGRVVWVIPPQNASDERDGPETAMDALIAGFAHARGLPLGIFWSKTARPVLDIFAFKT